MATAAWEGDSDLTERAWLPGEARDATSSEALRALAQAVAAGLGGSPKSLPAWMFYDAVGSALYEQITTLDEYYPTRTERGILARHADAIAARAGRIGEPVTVVELGAGTATKTVLVLRAMARRGPTTFVPIDVSATALDEAARRVQAEVPDVAVRPMEAHHADALARIAELPGRKVVLFIGSSIGNFEDDAATALLTGVRGALGAGDVFVLGTDLKKSPALLVPAYDDARGVTARFNRNVLARINRELGGHFEPERFDHVALWNGPRSRIEMHLESRGRQAVRVDALEKTFVFEDRERIHTESSVKYDLAHVDRLLGAAGLERVTTFEDDAGWFAVHLALRDRR